MSIDSELIQQLRTAVPVATRAECKRALEESDGDFDDALTRLAPVQKEADDDWRDRLEALAERRELIQLLTLAQQDRGLDAEWLPALKARAYQLCLDDILSDRHKLDPDSQYRRTADLTEALQRFEGLPEPDEETQAKLDLARRRSATQLLMATIMDYDDKGEISGRISFDDGEVVTQIRVFPRQGTEWPAPMELVESGADPNSTYGKNSGSYNEGKSVLMRAIETTGDEALARQLIAHGADPTFACGVNRDGTPRQDYTMLRACYITVSEDAGAGTYATTTDEVRELRSTTPMMGLDFVRLLLDKGVDPRIQNHRGGPLHYAASLDLPDHVLRLLMAGADPQQSFLTGGVGEMTPLHMARGYETTRLLLEWGANPRVKDDAGLTPEESARKHGGREEKIRALEDWSRYFTPMFTIQVGDTYRRNRHLVRMETKALDGGPLRREDLEAALRRALDRCSFSDPAASTDQEESGGESA